MWGVDFIPYEHESLLRPIYPRALLVRTEPPEPPEPPGVMPGAQAGAVVPQQVGPPRLLQAEAAARRTSAKTAVSATRKAPEKAAGRVAVASRAAARPYAPRPTALGATCTTCKKCRQAKGVCSRPGLPGHLAATPVVAAASALLQAPHHRFAAPDTSGVVCARAEPGTEPHAPINAAEPTAIVHHNGDDSDCGSGVDYDSGAAGAACENGDAIAGQADAMSAALAIDVNSDAQAAPDAHNIDSWVAAAIDLTLDDDDAEAAAGHDGGEREALEGVPTAGQPAVSAGSAPGGWATKLDQSKRTNGSNRAAKSKRDVAPSLRALRPPATIGDGVEIKTSTLTIEGIEGAGSGLFATRSFQRGELITEYDGTKGLSKEACQRRAPQTHMCHKDGIYVDGHELTSAYAQDPPSVQGRGGACFANYKRGEGNADFYLETRDSKNLNKIFIKACRRIEAGEEVFMVSYGSGNMHHVAMGDMMVHPGGQPHLRKRAADVAGLQAGRVDDGVLREVRRQAGAARVRAEEADMEDAGMEDADVEQADAEQADADMEQAGMEDVEEAEAEEDDDNDDDDEEEEEAEELGAERPQIQGRRCCAMVNYHGAVREEVEGVEGVLVEEMAQEMAQERGWEREEEREEEREVEEGEADYLVEDSSEEEEQEQEPGAARWPGEREELWVTPVSVVAAEELKKVEALFSRVFNPVSSTRQRNRVKAVARGRRGYEEEESNAYTRAAIQLMLSGKVGRQPRAAVSPALTTPASLLAPPPSPPVRSRSLSGEGALKREQLRATTPNFCQHAIRGHS